MASISITVTGRDGFEITRAYATDDDNVPMIVAAYVNDPAIASARDSSGAELPRDGGWAVSTWITESIGRAIEKAESYQRALAAAAAAASVPQIIIEEVEE